MPPKRYGVREEDIHAILLDAGFMPYDYKPLERSLTEISNFHYKGNTLYIRDIDWAQARVTGNRKFKVVGKEF